MSLNTKFHNDRAQIHGEKIPEIVSRYRFYTNLLDEPISKYYSIIPNDYKIKNLTPSFVLANYNLKKFNHHITPNDPDASPSNPNSDLFLIIVGGAMCQGA